VTFVWTHDSIGLGEDGPTHQPVEHYWALRAIPGFDVVRPADANETAIAWKAVLQRTDRPAGLLLSRQKLPVVDRGQAGIGSAEGAARGGYVIAEADGGQPPKVILIGTGSEVHIALAAKNELERDGIPTSVVSMPCTEWFEEQERAYREQVLPPGVTARVSVEAGVGFGWRQYVGDNGEVVSLEHYGASAAYEKLYEEFGITPERVVEAARLSLSRVTG
jgi:transketolase